MRSFEQGLCKIVGAAALAVLVVQFGGGIVSAETPTNVSGQVVCDENANQSVVWTFENHSQGTLTIAKATVDHSGLTSGSIGDANVNMGPSFIVPSAGNATGTTYTSNTPFVTLGQLSITVNFDGGSVSTTVQLVGCDVGVTTTTRSPTTTSPAATTTSPAVATTIQATTSTDLTGSGVKLPATGTRDSALLVPLAAALVGIGALLLTARRRSMR